MTIYWIVILFFAALSLGLVAIYLAYAAVQARPHHEVKKRLRELATNMDDRRFPADLRVEILGEMGLVDKFFYRFGFGKRIHRLIDSAGFKVDMKIYAAVTIFLAVVGFTAGILLGRGALGPLLLTPVGALIPLYFLLRKKRARIAKFTEFFPDTLDMISRSLKAGHSLSAAIQLVGTEMPEPTGAFQNRLRGADARALGARIPATSFFEDGFNGYEVLHHGNKHPPRGRRESRRDSREACAHHKGADSGKEAGKGL